MQPLDYIFVVMLAAYGVYIIFKFWYGYMRINRNTTDKIGQIYMETELKKRLRSKNETKRT